MESQMIRLAELLGLGGKRGSDEDTDDEQDMNYRKNKGTNVLYDGVKKYKNGGLYTG